MQSNVSWERWKIHIRDKKLRPASILKHAKNRSSIPERDNQPNVGESMSIIFTPINEKVSEVYKASHRWENL